ncbi:cardiolipin synthase (CMP-forming)-like [Clavelina lepadiformis]|uniref:cardiolipin synthase (CMP-forming) n=1 Tax=Clavelina lepadiformis TaxID=159417 RepID=A0ABP0GLI5_CLALP
MNAWRSVLLRCLQTPHNLSRSLNLLEEVRFIREFHVVSVRTWGWKHFGFKEFDQKWNLSCLSIRNFSSGARKNLFRFRYGVADENFSCKNCRKFQSLFVRLFSTQPNIENNHAKPEWENLLENEEKKNHIESIPVKRENIYTIPNLISTLRIAVTPYLGYLIINQDFSYALGLLFAAALTDVIDGQIARRWPSQQSAVGSALDPLADKILVAVVALSLTYVKVLPIALTALFVARDLILIIAVFYLRYRTCPRPITLKRYFDPSLVNTKLSPTFISKANTVLQILVIWCSAAAPVFGYLDHSLLHTLWSISAITTVASGVSYITRKDTVRILKDKDH